MWLHSHAVYMSSNLQVGINNSRDKSFRHLPSELFFPYLFFFECFLSQVIPFLRDPAQLFSFHHATMRFPSLAVAWLTACVAQTLANQEIPFDRILWGEDGPAGNHMVKRQSQTTSTATSTRVADSACTNGPLTRSCWSSGYSAATDFDLKWPTTGRTVHVSRSVSMRRSLR